MNTSIRKKATEKMVLAAILTAIVVVLQIAGSFVRFGPFSISLVLIPIVIGAATCGVGVGGWLGFVFGMAVLLSGDAAAFLTVSVPGTIITVLLKGTACGLCAGLAYKLFERFSLWVGAIAAAIVCPLVNTGVFLIGCFIFFMDTITLWAGGSDVGHYIIFGLVGGNFIFELLFNIVLSPVVVRLLNIKAKRN